MNKFWDWYERNYVLNVGISAVLFLLQLVHLYWLAAHVIALRIIGQSFFDPGETWSLIIILIDYLEIPTLISVSLVYINELRQAYNRKSLLYLFFLNSQWLHIFWITDEFVVEQFSGESINTLPVWLAWVAILIDYLELPVIIDTIKRFVKAVRENRLNQFLTEQDQ